MAFLTLCFLAYLNDSFSTALATILGGFQKQDDMLYINPNKLLKIELSFIVPILDDSYTDL